MTTLLFPGRHLVTTRFQELYLRQILNLAPGAIPNLRIGKVVPSGSFGRVVFAVTSSNQDNSRYNPIAFHLRAVGVDRFACSIETTCAVTHRIVGIPHYGHTEDFAAFTLKEIRDQSDRELVLTPENTIVLCSTPEVMALYEALGYCVAPAEHGVEPRPAVPIELVRMLGTTGAAWAAQPKISEELSSAARTWLRDFPEIPARIARIYQDPLTTQDGDLTETRNYSTYARGMSEIVRIKFLEIADAIKPGRIVDEGCADGALLVEVAKAFPDSDLYGVDLSSEFAARFQERQRAREFSGAYTHFLLRNLLDQLFEDGSIDTTICNSTLHELWSYAEQEKTVRRYLALKFAQVRPGGRMVVRDVVGPEDGERSVQLRCARNDGTDLPDMLPKHRDAAWLQSLATSARFRLFANDFLADRCQRDPSAPVVVFNELPGDDRTAVFSTTLRSAAEFLSKKDYADNWRSEMHEEFCFWSHAQWRTEFLRAGFSVIEPRDGKAGSRAYVNPWVVRNRYEGKVSLWTSDGTAALPFPPTNQIVVAEKPLH